MAKRADDQIRQATPSDADSLFPLVRAFATSFEPEQRAFRGSLKHILEDDHALLLVAEEHGGLVGYLLGFDHDTLFANGKVAWVEELMVVEEHRREGVGGALMQAVEDWASSRGCRLLALATRRASAFYLALGYEESATYFRRLLT